MTQQLQLSTVTVTQLRINNGDDNLTKSKQRMQQPHHFMFEHEGTQYQGNFSSVPLTEGESVEVVSQYVKSQQPRKVLAIRKAKEHAIWVAPGYEQPGTNILLVFAIVSAFIWVMRAKFLSIYDGLGILVSNIIIGLSLMQPALRTKVFQTLGFKQPNKVVLFELRQDWEARHQQPVPEQTDPYKFYYLPEHLKPESKAQTELEQRIAQERAAMEQRLKNNKTIGNRRY